MINLAQIYPGRHSIVLAAQNPLTHPSTMPFRMAQARRSNRRQNRLSRKNGCLVPGTLNLGLHLQQNLKDKHFASAAAHPLFRHSTRLGRQTRKCMMRHASGKQPPMFHPCNLPQHSVAFSPATTRTVTAAQISPAHQQRRGGCAAARPARSLHAGLQSCKAMPWLFTQRTTYSPSNSCINDAMTERVFKQPDGERCKVQASAAAAAAAPTAAAAPAATGMLVFATCCPYRHQHAPGGGYDRRSLAVRGARSLFAVLHCALSCAGMFALLRHVSHELSWPWGRRVPLACCGLLCCGSGGSGSCHVDLACSLDTLNSHRE